MNAFEALIARILAFDGYWVQSSYKVDLTKRQKQAIGRPSCPRWELDLLAYKGRSNEVLAVECKSYLDSRGVTIRAFDGSSDRIANRYKLFNDRKLCRVVFGQLSRELVGTGACRKNPQIRLCLAAGKIASAAEGHSLKTLFERKGWEFWDTNWITTRLSQMSRDGYDDSIASVVAKLIYRNPPD